MKKQQLKELLNQQKFVENIVVVDDASLDKTSKLAIECGAIV